MNNVRGKMFSFSGIKKEYPLKNKRRSSLKKSGLTFAYNCIQTTNQNLISYDINNKISKSAEVNTLATNITQKSATLHYYLTDFSTGFSQLRKKM